jgi:ribosome modulation factor
MGAEVNKDSFVQGWNAYIRGEGWASCPYHAESPAYRNWMSGWNAAKEKHGHE